MKDERALVVRAREGQKEALDTLAQEHRPALVRFLRRLVRGDATAAEDLAQDTLMTAFAALAQFRGDARFRTWLFTVARSRWLMSRRRRQGEPAELDELPPLGALGAEAGWGLPQDAGAFTERLEAKDTLEQALAGLSDDEREVVVLRDVEGLSGDEVAQVLGLGLAAMKSRLHRARLHLLANVKKGLGP